MSGPESTKENPTDKGPFAARVDTRGLQCPLPVLKAQKALAGVAPGALVEVLATDPLARIDLPHLARDNGHALLSAEETAGVWRFVLRAGAG